MKNKTLIFLLLLSVLPATGLAQKNALKALGAAGERAAMQTERRMARYPAGQTGLARAAQQNKKALYWAQTRVLGLSPKRALQNLEKIGVTPTFRGPLPAVGKTSFSAGDFQPYTLVAPKIAQAPAFPFRGSTNLIFRGLALASDGQAIANILQNGLRLSDVGTEANTLLRSYAGAAGAGAVKAVNAPITNLTDSPQAAADWAFRRLRDDYLAVVVAVKSNRKGDIITVAADIPAADIHSVSALLNLNGTLTWCKVQLNAAGNFIITPYAPMGLKSAR